MGFHLSCSANDRGISLQASTASSLFNIPLIEQIPPDTRRLGHELGHFVPLRTLLSLLIWSRLPRSNGGWLANGSSLSGFGGSGAYATGEARSAASVPEPCRSITAPDPELFFPQLGTRCRRPQDPSNSVFFPVLTKLGQRSSTLDALEKIWG